MADFVVTAGSTIKCELVNGTVGRNALHSKLFVGNDAVIVAGILWSASKRLYAAPRAELHAEIEKLDGAVASYRKQLDDDFRVQESLRATADRTLGADVETVDHRLRTRLNRIAEAIELGGATVGTGAVSVQRSPARSAFPRRGAWKTLRDAVDFVEVEGWVSSTTISAK